MPDRGHVMQTFKTQSSVLHQRLAAEQKEVGSLKQSLAYSDLAKRQAAQVSCLGLCIFLRHLLMC